MFLREHDITCLCRHVRVASLFVSVLSQLTGLKQHVGNALIYYYYYFFKSITGFCSDEMHTERRIIFLCLFWLCVTCDWKHEWSWFHWFVVVEVQSGGEISKVSTSVASFVYPQHLSLNGITSASIFPCNFSFCLKRGFDWGKLRSVSRNFWQLNFDVCFRNT